MNSRCNHSFPKYVETVTSHQLGIFMLLNLLLQALDTNFENMRMETWQNACTRHVGLNTFGNEHVDVNLMSLFGAAIVAHQPWQITSNSVPCNER